MAFQAAEAVPGARVAQQRRADVGVQAEPAAMVAEFR
jgi:hypothetical protein